MLAFPFQASRLAISPVLLRDTLPPTEMLHTGHTPSSNPKDSDSVDRRQVLSEPQLRLTGLLHKDTQERLDE